ncbi:sensor histidine kinase [Micromonospora rubida]|uniref:sensor histidine kinase n=1 Tax=Micromonospora rubida TaxID=2697657 RepID=UPI001378A8DE|nr:histidine kinase [Micromonospora rubida]NBE79745.1 sensor histidine kinase [Micromonospora rubida]
MTRFALAIPRCVALVALSVAGFAYGHVLVVAATLVVTYPLAVSGQYRLTALARRLARAWAGAVLPDPVRSLPPTPHRREDGWYAHDDTVFRSPRVPAFLLKLDHYAKDPTVGREWLWLILTPVIGAVPILVPPALIAAGVFLLASPPWPLAWSVPAAGGAVVAAFLLAPGALRAYGLWAGVLLGTGEPPQTAVSRWVTRTSAATWRGAGLAGLTLAGFGGLLLNLLAAALSWGGLLPYTLPVTRSLVELYRRHVGRWTGTDLPAPYRPYPPAPSPGKDGSYRVGRVLYTDLPAAVQGQRPGWLLGDPATWRDQLWSLGSVALAPLSFVPAVLVGLGFYGLFCQPLTWVGWAVPIGLFTGYWVTPFYLWFGIEHIQPDASWLPGWASMTAGLAMALLGLGLASPLMRLRLWWDRLLLTPTAATVLASRVAHLATTRADAVDVQATELRRIERDLHDGAQARLIAVGLGLAAVARLMETDPVRARRVLEQAQETSAAALAELRDLVRGIHPPVLAERGLGDAIRAIALDTPLPVDVDVDLPGRLDAPVESAAYFVTCEALTNAARCASHISISLSHRDGVLRVVVTDDGPGGADPTRGTGLRGIQRRLATFDGTMTPHSPPGGPTVVTMEIPCASSSPRTSTS